MSRGRLIIAERKRRLYMLLEFVTIARYATRKQLLKFTEKIIKLSNPRWLVDYAIKKGFIKAYYSLILKSKVYYLTSKGKKLLWEVTSIAHEYRFDKRRISLKTFVRQNAVADAYLLLYGLLRTSCTPYWIPEWGLRLKQSKRAKLPDASIATNLGIEITLIIITGYRDIFARESVICEYSHKIKEPFEGILIITPNKNYMDRLITRLVERYPKLRYESIIFTYPALLENKQCYYKGSIIDLMEAGKLARD